MKKTALLLAAVMLVMSLAGCASREAYVPTGNGLADVTQPTEATEPEVEAPGGLHSTASDLTLAYFPKEGFDPYECTNINNRMIFSLIYQSLFVTDSRYNVEPQLCKSFTVDQEMTTYVFTLERATFADGTELTALDVVESLNLAKKSDYYSGRFTYIKRIAEIEGNRVKITTSTPMENLPLLLDIPIIKAGQAEGTMPMGTGPYVLQEQDGTLSLERRTEWWCAAQVPVKAQTIRLMAGENPTQVRDEFEFGDLSISTADPGSASYAAYRCDYELWDAESGVFLYLGCNIRSKVFSQSQVRVALSYAIDRAELLASCYNGFGAAATLPASPDSPYYDQRLARQITYDPSVFRQALEEANMVGKSIRLLVNKNDSVRLQTARKIAKMLTDCGLVVEVFACDYTDYRAVLRDGNFDLYLGQTKLSPNMDLSKFFQKDASLSWGGMADEACLRMCQEALENSGNYYNLHQMILRNGQLVPILFRSQAVYAERGLVRDLDPSRDNVFYYSMGKSLEEARSVISGDN